MYNALAENYQYVFLLSFKKKNSTLKDTKSGLNTCEMLLKKMYS